MEPAARWRPGQYPSHHPERSLANSEFDFLQDEFLTKNHTVTKAQDRREKEGITTANAELGYTIRDGIDSMRELVGKMREEYRRISKKKVH